MTSFCDSSPAAVSSDTDVTDDAEVGRIGVAGGSDTWQPRAIVSARTSISAEAAAAVAAAAETHEPFLAMSGSRTAVWQAL